MVDLWWDLVISSGEAEASRTSLSFGFGSGIVIFSRG